MVVGDTILAGLPSLSLIKRGLTDCRSKGRQGVNAVAFSATTFILN